MSRPLGRLPGPRGPATATSVAPVGADRVVGDLELVALADEEAERPVALAVALGRDPKAAAQRLQSGVELRRRRGRAVRAGVQGGGDELAVDAGRLELALDPLVAPVVQRAP